MIAYLAFNATSICVVLALLAVACGYGITIEVDRSPLISFIYGVLMVLLLIAVALIPGNSYWQYVMKSECTIKDTSRSP